MSFWTKKRVSTGFACLIVVVLVVVVGGLYYSKGQAQVPANIDESDRSSHTPEQPLTSRTRIHISGILQQWSTGRQEEAVRDFLHLAETQPSAASYRPFDFSEEQFVSLPEAERDLMQEKILAKLKVLRKFARELDRRAKAALRTGDYTTAERLLVSMKRLGAANTGPEVTRVVELVGRAIESLADGELVQLDKSASK